MYVAYIRNDNKIQIFRKDATSASQNFASEKSLSFSDMKYLQLGHIVDS